MALAPAPEVPGFHALSPLGAGAAGTLFSAQSEEMGRWVALTIYSSARLDHNRFRRAFELARRLGVHPHAVTVLDCGVTPDHQPYVVTEFYEHGTFDTRVSGNQPLPVDKTLRIGIALAGALETAHRAQVIHGGVHPARVLADSDDEPSLADLGLVPLVDPRGRDALLGPTNYHAPPEVLEEERLSPRTDVFALASTLYTLLTARPPYWSPDSDDTAAALLLRILRHDVPPLSRPDAPPSLEQVLRNALHSDPARRPAGVIAFAQSLQRVQQEIGAPVTQPVLLDVAAGLQALPTHAPTAPPPVPRQTGPNGGPPARPPVVEPNPGTDISARQVFVPYPVPEPEPDPWFGPPAPPPAPETPEPPLHERLAAENPWPAPPRPEAAVEAAAEPEAPADPAPAAAPEASPQAVRGPRALPVIVLGAIVAALLAGAVWLVLSGPDPDEADVDPTEQISD